LANTARSQRFRFTEFPLSLGNGIAINARDPLQRDNTACFSLEREEANQESAQSFVRNRQEPVDGSMLSRSRSAWMQLANGAGTNMDVLSMCHESLPP